MKPDEFWNSTPGELIPYLEARIEYIQEQNDIDNQRFGLICAVLQNGIPVGLMDKRPKKHTPKDYFRSPKIQRQEKQQSRNDEIQSVYGAMQSWCKVSGGGK
jgi:hypothetical protein